MQAGRLCSDNKTFSFEWKPKKIILFLKERKTRKEFIKNNRRVFRKELHEFRSLGNKKSHKTWKPSQILSLELLTILNM